MGFQLLAIALTACAVPILLTYLFFAPPKSFPKNIPSVPFYYTLIPLFKDVDQSESYRKYLESPLKKYGAVKIFFGGRWNILVQRPAYIAEVLKHEDVYAKSGNQKKIPYSVLAEYTGDNIISSHGKDWRLYQSVIKPGLQQDVEARPVYSNAQKLVDLLLEEQASSDTKSALAPRLLQRYTLANLSESLLGASFGTLQSPNAPLHAFQNQIKPLIFHPIFLNFPFLDHFPIPMRISARKLARAFANELCNTVLRAHQQHAHSDISNAPLGCRLVAAKDDRTWTDTQFQHNMISTFLAGHENPQLLLTSALFLLAEHPEWQRRVREEVSAAESSALHDLPILTSIIYETLRLYPPISQLINRCTTSDVALGGKIPIPAGTYVGYNAYATGRDSEYWGADADEFRPQRWGEGIEEVGQTYRRANVKGGFIAFHGGRRACLGQKFAMFEAKITLTVMLKRLEWRIDPGWERRMTPVSWMRDEWEWKLLTNTR